jgi:hypothetical protein
MRLTRCVGRVGVEKMLIRTQLGLFDVYCSNAGSSAVEHSPYTGVDVRCNSHPAYMRALLCHCRHYRSEVRRLSDAPLGMRPENFSNKLMEANDAIVVLVTVEPKDEVEMVVPQLSNEVRKMCRDTGHSTVVLLPFAHLSNKLAGTDTTLAAMNLLESDLKDLGPVRAHFGSDKKLLLDIFGHKGNVRYREF